MQLLGACSPGHPELSKSYMDLASKLFTFTLDIYIYYHGMAAIWRSHSELLSMKIAVEQTWLPVTNQSIYNRLCRLLCLSLTLLSGEHLHLSHDKLHDKRDESDCPELVCMYV